ncbi:TIGR01244 family sulfur transferase [Qipengyuania seohaensis]|uniref:TIGR01244 family sulfur transferase n=1 Tax=Qipengyuania seohaensis TaxID=266951 RepID=UPI000C21CF99|nr:TIGR01244 family sulfur transferase [Qipengyuania seohaensis]
MEIFEVTPDFAVAAQIRPEDVAALHERGVVALICNRPDGEEEGQPEVAAIRRAAEQQGMAFHHIPVSGGNFPDGAVAAFRAVRRGTDGPILAYCRTGTRSITLDTLADPDGVSPAERIRRANAAGYDLSAIEGQLI